jgi:hypothetical protein
MADSERIVIGGEIEQGVLERIAYRVTVPESWGTPATATFILYDITKGAETNVTSTKLSGAGSVAGAEITTPLVISLVAQHQYELHTTFVTGSNTLDFIIPIRAKR